MEKAFMNHEIIYEKKLAIMRRGVALIALVPRNGGVPTPATHHSDSLESSPTPSIIMSPSVRSTATATDRASGGPVG